MWTALSNRIRRCASRRGGDAGFAIVLVGLLLVFLLLVAAIVVDLANARQQNRDAVAAADAGALAGAQALTGTATMPTPCSNAGIADLNCLAAYHTFASVNIVPSSISRSSTCTLEGGTDTCYEYTSGGTTVDVKYPYTLTGYTSSNLVRVKVCWDASTSFARVIGDNFVNVCGAATARWTGNVTPPGPDPVTTDCSVEDNFADTSDKPTIYVFNPGDYPAVGGTIDFTKGAQVPKNNEDLVVVFDGRGTELDTSSVVWMAPTTASGPTWPVVNGNVVQLPPIANPNSNNGPESGNAHGIGYVLQSLDTGGRVRAYNPTLYPASAGNKTLITYQLPDDAHLKPNGQTYVYTSTLHANDSDNNGANPPTHCGNAKWVFNHDGSYTGTCGENSFFAFAPWPASGSSIVAGQTIVQAYYTDESQIQVKDYADASWPQPPSQSTDFGIDFRYTLNGTTTRIPQYDSTIHTNGFAPPSNPSGAYWFTRSDAAHSKDTYNVTINWMVPLTFANGNYSIYLKAFDTDNNKPGNDCGVFQWTETVTGGSTGAVNLVE